jgi:Fibronectin type III domain/PA14 domain
LYRYRFFRLFIFAPLIFLLFVPSVSASLEPGIQATVYNNFGYNGAPPLPEVSGRPSVGQMTVSRVEQNFDQSPPFGLYEDFLVQYKGYVTSPVSGSFRFWPQADDGTQLYIDDVRVQNDWIDKGGGGVLSDFVTFEAGVSKKFEMWFYENGGGAWTTLYWDIGQGWEVVPDSAFTQQSVPTTTTTIAPYLNNPQNLTVTSTNESKVYLSWDVPEESNASVERYAIFWSCDNWASGFAISSLTTSAVVENFEPEQSCQFKVRADNDSIPVYSGWSNEVNGVTLPTTTTSTTTTTTTTSTIVEQEVPEWTTTTVLTPPATVTPNEPVDETPPSTSNPESDEPVSEVPQYAPPEDEAPLATEPEIVVSEEVQVTADEEVAAIFDSPITEEELQNAVGELLTNAESPEELTAVVNSLLEQDLTDEQFLTVIDTIFSESLSDENFSAAIDAVFSEPLSDEKFDAVIDAVLDQALSDEQFEELVGVLESDTVSEEQVAAAVDSIIELGVTEDQATELATSAKVLESIDGEQATEIFAAVDISAVTEEEAEQLVSAVQDAPTEVREALESEINVFQGAIDTYVPLGSNVPVGTRRVIIGASALAIFCAPVPASRRS